MPQDRVTRAFADKICAAFPGATRSDPSAGDLDSWKLNGKMFACFGGSEGSTYDNHGVSVKTPDADTAEMLIAAGRATRAPYFHKSWVRILWGSVEEDELADRLTASYDFIRSKLSKKAQKALPPRADTQAAPNA